MRLPIMALYSDSEMKASAMADKLFGDWNNQTAIWCKDTSGLAR